MLRVSSGTASATATIELVDPEPSFMLVNVNKNVVEADGIDSVQGFVQVFDALGEPLPNNTPIDLSLEYPDLGYLDTKKPLVSAGQGAQFEYFAPTTAGVNGTQTIYATYNGRTESKTISLKDIRTKTMTIVSNPQTLEIGQLGSIITRQRDNVGILIKYANEVTFTASSTYVTLLVDSAETIAEEDLQIGEELGKAEIQIRGEAVTNSVFITAWTQGIGGQISASTELSIISTGVGTMEFVESVPSIIGVAGASSFGNGVVEDSAVVRFRVLTSYGEPVPDGTLVSFTVTGPVGASILQTNSGTIDGVASTIVRGGRVSGTLRVLAETSFDSQVFRTWSAPIAVQSGPPAHRNMTIGLADDTVSMPGFAFNNLDGQVQVSLADRYGNPVPQGTQVYLSTEAGVIQASGSSNELGQVTVDYYTGNPEPIFLGDQYVDVDPYNDGVFRFNQSYRRQVSANTNSQNTILAVVVGEESFVDANGDGIYNTGETIFDLTEPYLDQDSNGSRRGAIDTYTDDDGETITLYQEPFWDYNENGVFDSANGQWDGQTFIWRDVRQTWYGTAASVAVLPSTFIDIDSDGEFDSGQDIVFANGTTAGSAQALALCGGAGTFVNFGSSQGISVVLSDARGLRPGRYGTGQASIDIPDEFFDLDLFGYIDTPLVENDAFANRDRVFTNSEVDDADVEVLNIPFSVQYEFQGTPNFNISVIEQGCVLQY